MKSGENPVSTYGGYDEEQTEIQVDNFKGPAVLGPREQVVNATSTALE